MASRLLLIDGYNLLHAAGLAQRNYRKGELRRQREQLLKRLMHWLTPAEASRTTVIFDARDPAVDRPHRTRFQSLEVIFARPEGDADVVIGKWLDAHPHPRQVTLVSGDRALQRAARSAGSTPIGSVQFLHELALRREHKVQRAEREQDKPTTPLTPAEAAYLTELFGGFDLPELERECEIPAPLRESVRVRPVAEAEASPTPGGPVSKSTRPPRKRSVPSPAPPASIPTGSNGIQRANVGKSAGEWFPRKPGEGDAKPVVGHELEYWMREFGKLSEQFGGNSTRPAMSLAELERWLRQMQSGTS